MSSLVRDLWPVPHGPISQATKGIGDDGRACAYKTPGYRARKLLGT